jgi:hypothetical protein
MSYIRYEEVMFLAFESEIHAYPSSYFFTLH